MSVPGHSPPKMQVGQPLADEREGEDDGLGDAQPGARQQVVGQRVAGEAGGQGEQQQEQPDDPVQLAGPAEGAGEEDPRHVQGDGADEHERRPVVHLADQQPALDVEGDAQHRVVGRRHLDAAQRRVRALVDQRLLGALEEERQVDAGDQQDDEAVQRQLAPQEREVVGEDLVQHLADERLAADPSGHRLDVALDEPAPRRLVVRPSCPAGSARSGRSGRTEPSPALMPRSRRAGRRGRRSRPGRRGSPGRRRRGRAAAASGSPGRRPGGRRRAGSKIDWWHGQTSWRNVSGARLSMPNSPTEQPAWVQILE